MGKILVSGLVNIENNLKVDEFPIQYNSVNYTFFGINTNIGGVGYNVAKALSCLGDEVVFCTAIGEDINGSAILSKLEEQRISTKSVAKIAKSTPQSIILYDGEGKRQIYTDLKDVQELKYPADMFEEEYKSCDILALCNINFSREHLAKAKNAGKLIATDVHAISDINDQYNQDFMKNADILFFSNDKLGKGCEDFLKEAAERFENKIIVAGMGGEGAMLYVRDDNFLGKFSAYKTRKVVNTVGAGDSLFSSFIHFYVKDYNPYISLKKAMLFASYKIGESGASNGFLTEEELERLALNPVFSAI